MMMALDDLLEILADDPLSAAIKRRPSPTANRILRKYKVHYPPVPIDEIVYAFGIKIKDYLPDSNQLAVAQTDKSPPTIMLHSQLQPYDRRFALAHSFGHVVLHPPGQYIDSTYSGSIEESQANEFAASLLMPYSMVEPLLLRGFPPTKKELAGLFQIPEHQAYIQFMSHANLPVKW